MTGENKHVPDSRRFTGRQLSVLIAIAIAALVIIIAIGGADDLINIIGAAGSK